jgi:hypothetical protein
MASLKFAAARSPEPDIAGDPWLILSHDGYLTVGFEYGERTVRLSVEEGDQHLLADWADAADRKLRGVVAVWPRGYEGYNALLDAGDFNSEGMYVDKIDDFSRHLCVIACPVCGREGKPLVRAETYYVGGDWRWVGLDHKEPFSDYRTRCRCGAEFRFTIYTPQ